MSGYRLWIMTVASILLLSAYPITQSLRSGGWLFYTNAFDEPTYLQYDFSRASQSATRVGQYVVTTGHELGLSGGWLNAILDVSCLAAFVAFTAGAFRRAGWEAPLANRNAFLLTFLPLIFGGLNPVVARLFGYNLSSGLIYWVTIPEASFLPLVRSPEPQVSLVLASASVYWALRRRNWLYVYVCLPFLYTFVAVPVAFATVSLHLKDRFKLTGKNTWMCFAAAFGLIGLAVFSYVHVLVPARIRDLLVPTHLPLLSFTGLLALAIGAFGRRRTDMQWRFLLLTVCLAPISAANQQVLSGWLAQPNQYEQYVGTICAAGAMILCCRRRLSAEALVVLSLFAAAWSGWQNFAHNDAVNSRLVLTHELLGLLRQEPERVAISDASLAARASLIFPRQRITLFGYQKTFGTLRENSAREYYCARDQIAANAELQREFAEVFQVLDRGFEVGPTGNVLVHIGRKAETPAQRPRSRSLPGRGCRRRELRYVVPDPRAAGGPAAPLVLVPRANPSTSALRPPVRG